MTGKSPCAVCKVVGLVVGIGALNWGLLALFNLDLVAKFLGPMTNNAAKAAYIVIGIAGLLKLLSLVKCCPCQGEGCGTKK